MSEKLNRREFINLNWESTISFLGNILVPQIEMERNFIRPPGACSELAFLASCTRCGGCRDVCPEQTIHLFELTDGAKLVNTPYLNLTESPCTFCKKCIEVCPTEALSLKDYKDRPYLGLASVRFSECLAHQNVMCDYCVRACPEEGALKLINGVPVVSEYSCTGCGTCVLHCIAERKAIKVMVKE